MMMALRWKDVYLVSELDSWYRVSFLFEEGLAAPAVGDGVNGPSLTFGSVRDR